MRLRFSKSIIYLLIGGISKLKITAKKINTKMLKIIFCPKKSWGSTIIINADNKAETNNIEANVK